MIYSEKQRALLRRWQEGGLRRINVLEGAVRSGKTWISLVLWAFWVATMPPDGTFLMAGKTVTSLDRNVLHLLCELVGSSHFTYSVSKGEGRLFGRRVYFVGAGDMRAEGKIRGLTLDGAYCDELTLFPEGFFVMLLGRLSRPGAKLFATTNPDGPEHWLKVRYLDRADQLDLLREKFLLEDNPFLEASYVRELKKEYTGMFYERYILGNWVAAEGLVYPMFSKERHVVRGPYGPGRYYVSVDYGTVNPCSMGLWLVEEHRAVRIREFYHDSRKARHQMTDEEYYEALEGLVQDAPVERIVVDPSAASFIECIRRRGRFSVRRADNAVLSGIRTVCTALSGDVLFFDESCKNTIAEFGAYMWDEGARGDSVIKAFDHAMDDIRYFCTTILKRNRGVCLRE